MTIPDDQENQEPEPAPEEIPNYVIDSSRAEQLGLSLPTLLLSRRCPSCQARLEANQEMPSEKEHIKELAKCCAKQEGFIRPEMPFQEILFRAIASEGNKPVSLERLHYLVTEGWYSPINPRSITMNGLKLVLDNDTYYGFNKVSET